MATAECTVINENDSPDIMRAQIRAFIYSMRPLRGSADLAESDRYQRGRALLEMLADSAKDEDDPRLLFSPAQCAQVCDYLSNIEPFDAAAWWDDPSGGPSHLVGFYAVVRALGASIRGELGDDGDAKPNPGNLHERMEKEQRRVYEVHSLVDLVQTQLHTLTGDEDALDVAQESAEWVNVLEVAKRQLNQIAERIELMQKESRP